MPTPAQDTARRLMLERLKWRPIDLDASIVKPTDPRKMLAALEAAYDAGEAAGRQSTLTNWPQKD